MATMISIRFVPPPDGAGAEVCPPFVDTFTPEAAASLVTAVVAAVASPAGVRTTLIPSRVRYPAAGSCFH